MPSRRDVKLGRVAPKEIRPGVFVPPGAQIDHETLEEHQERLIRQGYPPYTREEALRQYEPDEVEEVFGPVDGPPPAPPKVRYVCTMCRQPVPPPGKERR
jgi:hypothetical protein